MHTLCVKSAGTRTDKPLRSNLKIVYQKWVNDIGELCNAPRSFARFGDGCARDARANAHDRELDE